MSSKARKRSIEAHKQKAEARGTAYLGRNSTCPCGSGKKIKKCCLRKIQAIAALPPAVRDSLIVNRILHGANAAPLPGATGPTPIPPAVAARFAAIRAAQAAAQAANPDDSTAQVVAGMAVASVPTDAYPQQTGIKEGYVEYAGERFEIEHATVEATS